MLGCVSFEFWKVGILFFIFLSKGFAPFSLTPARDNTEVRTHWPRSQTWPHHVDQREDTVKVELHYAMQPFRVQEAKGKKMPTGEPGDDDEAALP